MTTMIDIQNMARASAANTNFANGDPFVLENFDPFFADFTKTFHNYLMKINWWIILKYIHFIHYITKIVILVNAQTFPLNQQKT